MAGNWAVWRLGDAPDAARLHLLSKPRLKRPRLRSSIGTTLPHPARSPIPDPWKVSGGSLIGASKKLVQSGGKTRVARMCAAGERLGLSRSPGDLNKEIVRCRLV